MAGPDVGTRPKKLKRPHMVKVGGVLVNVTEHKRYAAGAAKGVAKGATKVAQAVTAASPGTIAGKAAGWLKRQGFVPSYK